ncbi:cyclopropane fatty acyl phospholipid synthase [Microbulbifer thermotolerans]|uniref:Cyclopropane-fatty-acyl-phospholipid synthase n=1 Tax=Microbulbifer thermotolerans TaxID=252514 RepID=A0A143HNK8_MICTH|nr:cyclopropane fatty acyl phospholipid synthase [Microbulbifer thermotolerans]AMX03020.1 cyclopropane-fatty-acyl-phospholipid synthase [Microbulbifer thermotolerans]MCX2781513.1 cyclopropane fatty acyl phospholipid synthase [Microbulbifer thermotolerans]MCX2795752.1 cyclopropane fatty acyl phospholipid synthase [Microbulbifer thermotolerans]MCX2802006.1 cyclopropane fatty acyl phospholipid synthase [Microbulbifer thermotolerans]MCX2835279.1 cyclopropane fatty acyl phospholipid synthase [Micro
MATEQQDTMEVPAVGRSRHLLDEVFGEADIRINGDRPWDMRLHRAEALDEIVARHSLGLGETYMRGDWDVPSLDQFFYRILTADLPRYIKPWRNAGRILRSYLINLQSRRRAFKVGEHHYDLGNDFYQAMLDSRMTYSCGYWREAKTLEEAQTAKLDLICRKLGLKPGMRLLDIGCGWGSLISYAAKNYGVECVGVTVSREQSNYIAETYADLPITVHLRDYRSLDQPFDRIASVGMFEHVGRKNHRTFMRVVKRCLKKDGLMLLHTIGKNLRHSTTDPWIEKYIFPNGELPSAGQITDAADNLLVCEDMHNFGSDYEKTLLAWHANFERHWERFAEQYGQQFYRMWRYYLLSCAGAFRARYIQLWQWMFSDRLQGGIERVS